jgi:hypothetical protein
MPNKVILKDVGKEAENDEIKETVNKIITDIEMDEMINKV